MLRMSLIRLSGRLARPAGACAEQTRARTRSITHFARRALLVLKRLAHTFSTKPRTCWIMEQTQAGWCSESCVRARTGALHLRTAAWAEPGTKWPSEAADFRALRVYTHVHEHPHPLSVQAPSRSQKATSRPRFTQRADVPHSPCRGVAAAPTPTTTPAALPPQAAPGWQ